MRDVEYAANGTTVVETGHFAYDALDRRARQTVVNLSNQTTVDERYVYESGELALVYDLLGGGGATAREKLRERYLNARGVDLVLSVEPLTHSASGANTAAGQASWYLHDHLGTPRDTLRRSSTSPATVQHWQQFRYDAWAIFDTPRAARLP